MSETDPTKASYDIIDRQPLDSESSEWEFYRVLTVRINNPHGRDVISKITAKARPEADDITSNPDHIHLSTKYWWPDAKPGQGDGPFAGQTHSFSPSTDIEMTDDQGLLEEVESAICIDALAELEAIEHNSSRDIVAELGVSG